MTKDQISLIREVAQKDDGTGNPLASVLSAIFNDEIMFRNTDDFVIYDDDNELIHAIKANYDNAIAGAAWPYKICTGFYGNIQFMEGLYDMKNFEKAIDQLFLNTGLIDVCTPDSSQASYSGVPSGWYLACGAHRPENEEEYHLQYGR